MNKPILFVKQGCPWCADALSYFAAKKLDLEVVDVRLNPHRMDDLIEASGQSKTPTLMNGEFVVADFDLGEFEEAMLENPAEAAKLGI